MEHVLRKSGVHFNCKIFAYSDDIGIVGRFKRNVTAAKYTHTVDNYILNVVHEFVYNAVTSKNDVNQEIKRTILLLPLGFIMVSVGN